MCLSRLNNVPQTGWLKTREMCCLFGLWRPEVHRQGVDRGMPPPKAIGEPCLAYPWLLPLWQWLVFPWLVDVSLVSAFAPRGVLPAHARACMCVSSPGWLPLKT